MSSRLVGVRRALWLEAARGNASRGSGLRQVSEAARAHTRTPPAHRRVRAPRSAAHLLAPVRPSLEPAGGGTGLDEHEPRAAALAPG